MTKVHSVNSIFAKCPLHNRVRVFVYYFFKFGWLLCCLWWLCSSPIDLVSRLEQHRLGVLHQDSNSVHHGLSKDRSLRCGKYRVPILCQLKTFSVVVLGVLFWQCFWDNTWLSLIFWGQFWHAQRWTMMFSWSARLNNWEIITTWPTRTGKDCTISPAITRVFMQEANG